MSMPPMREWRPGEVFVNHALVNAQGLENLRAAVTLDGGDAHLGDGLDDAFGGGLEEILDGLFLVYAVQEALLHQMLDGPVSQIRVDDGRPRSR